MTIIIIVLVLIGIFVIVRAKHISPLSLGVYDKFNQDIFSDTAINGYDPVSYVEQQKAEKGSDDFTWHWNGATWKFSSAKHLNLFKNNPGKYAPVYGGYCGFAVSKGFSANIDPEAFTIQEGKLYLFSEPKFRDRFLEDFEASKDAADKNWDKVK